MSKSIREWQGEVHGLAKEKGWWTGEKDLYGGVAPLVVNLGEKLMLVTSELAEALEEARRPGFHPAQADLVYFSNQAENAKPEGFGIELADAVIRILDLCGAMGIDLEAAIGRKHEYNKTRPYRNGKRF